MQTIIAENPFSMRFLTLYSYKRWTITHIPPLNFSCNFQPKNLHISHFFRTFARYFV